MFSQRHLLVATAALEIGSGLVALAWPAWSVLLLFGAADVSPEASATGRLLGAALLALGVGCWCVRNVSASGSVRAVLCGMLIYNIGASSVLALVAVVDGMMGVLLWSAALLHAALTLWCVSVLRGATSVSSNVGRE